MKMIVMKTLMVAGFGVTVLALAGCNTTEGVGEDIESVGDEIDDSVD